MLNLYAKLDMSIKLSLQDVQHNYMNFFDLQIIY